MLSRIQDDWMDSSLALDSGRSFSRRASLVFTIKVYLQRESGQLLTWNTDNGTRNQRTIDWGDAWNGWSDRLKRVVENGWNDKLYLEPSCAWLPEDRRATTAPTYVPSVALGLRIECVPRAAAHVVIRCHRLPEATPGNPNPFARSWMQGPFSCTSRRRSARGGTTHGALDSRDLEPRASGQIPAVHEFGHYIGLQHVNAAAVPQAPNSSGAYGRGYQRGDIMGGGTRIEGWHAYPWCRRLRRHLGARQPGTTDWLRRGPTMVWQTGTGAETVEWRVRCGAQAYPAYVGRPAELILPA